MWLKIKVWTKVVLFVLLLLYASIFIFKNTDKSMKFWYWPYREPELPVLWLVFGAFVVGVIGTLLMRTLFKTIRQIRELQSRSRADRLQREVDDMRTKAAALRTKPVSETASDESLA